MSRKIFAPLIGEGVDEISVIAWKKNVGEFVNEGESLLEIESDKVTTEVPSPASGRLLEILVQAGGIAKAGGVVAILADEETGSPSAAPAMLAASPPAVSPPLAPKAEVDHRPHGALRRKIAERMIESQRTSAHVLTVMEADLGAIVAHRAANKGLYAAQGARLTLSAYFVAALASALRLRPDVNSSWGEDGMTLHPDINIGFAVSLGEAGLIVPVVKKADASSLAEIARGIDALATAARAGTLSPEDVRGGTFTLSNHGTGGSLLASPIINQPQIGILGTGAMQKRAVVVTDAEGIDSIEIRPMVYLSFVFDHRALDGDSADSFLRSVKAALESWEGDS
jgi:2-oxoglutarate dehydrogenase E2 component (dihydrolipoamide succinyltransferase)